MDLKTTATKALSLLWTNKHLWFFGFFVAASGGASGSGGNGGAAAAPGAATLPGWLPVAVAGALLLGLVFFVLHVLSEAALIEAVRRDREGTRLGIREGLGEGRRHFWSLLGTKLAFALLTLVVAAVMVAPAILGALEVFGVPLAVVLSLPLVLAGVPTLLTLHFLYEWTQRFVVLGGRTAVDAAAAGRRFLAGRLLDSVKVMLLSFAGQVGGGLAAVVGLLPGVAVGGLVWLAAGTLPALVVGGAIGLPLAVAAVGAGGTFRSSVWTLAFLEARGC